MKFKIEKRYSKTPKLSTLKKAAWKVFSEWVRKQGMDDDGFNICYCCRKRYHWKKLQAGHCISRTHANTFFDDMNVKPCCFACNIWKRGNIAEFSDHLIEEYGIVAFQELIKRGRELKKFSKGKLENLIEYYKHLTDAGIR